jgi:hypothetical protein
MELVPIAEAPPSFAVSTAKIVIYFLIFVTPLLIIIKIEKEMVYHYEKPQEKVYLCVGKLGKVYKTYTKQNFRA